MFFLFFLGYFWNFNISLFLNPWIYILRMAVRLMKFWSPFDFESPLDRNCLNFSCSWLWSSLSSRLNANWNKTFCCSFRNCFALDLKCSNPWRVRPNKIVSSSPKYSNHVWNHFRKFEGYAWLRRINNKWKTGLKKRH